MKMRRAEILSFVTLHSAIGKQHGGPGGMNKCYFPFTCTSESLRDTGLDGEQSDMRRITVSTETVSRDTQPSNSLFLSLLRKYTHRNKVERKAPHCAQNGFSAAITHLCVAKGWNVKFVMKLCAG